MTKAEFCRAMALLSAAVGRPMPTEQAEAWFLLLGDLTASELQAGIAGALQAHTYAGLPPVGLIRQHARPQMRALAGDGDTLALSSWAAVLDAMKAVGAYRSVDFGALTNATIRALGGWSRLTEQTSDDLLRFVRPQFLQTFKALSAVGVRADAAEPLPGLVDVANSRTGFAAAEPVRIDLHLPGPAPRVLPALAGPQRSAPRLTERSVVADDEAVPETVGAAAEQVAERATSGGAT